MGISRPAVSEMIKRLEHEGLVDIDGKIRLTKQGRALAEQVVRRHRLAERFLTDILQLSWADAHHEAGKWEHVISESVESAIDRVLGEPTTCPHGNPIPGSSYAAPDAHPLSALSVGATFTVSRIPEELEFTPGLLDFLEESAITPGRIGTITAASPDGTVTVEIEGHSRRRRRLRERSHPRHRVVCVAVVRFASAAPAHCVRQSVLRAPDGALRRRLSVTPRARRAAARRARSRAASSHA